MISTRDGIETGIAMARTGRELIENLQRADAQNQGIFLELKELNSLAEFSKKALALKPGCDSKECNIDLKKAFVQLLNKVAGVVNVKAGLAFTAEEVTTWYAYFERCVASTAFSKVSFIANDDQLKALLSYNRKTSPFNKMNESWSNPDTNAVEALHNAVLRLAEGAVARQDVCLEYVSAECLYRFFNYHEKNGAIPPLADTTDPLHPRLTALEKLKGVVRSGSPSFYHLDSEEVLCMDKILDQLWDASSVGRSKAEQRELSGQGKQEQSKSPLAAKFSNENVKASSTTTQNRGDRTQTRNIQAKPSASKMMTAEKLVIDESMKTLVMKYCPKVVQGVLKDKQPLIARWMEHIEHAFESLDEDNKKTRQEVEDLKSMMLDEEQEYEKLLKSSREDYEDMKNESERKLANLERELQSANEEVNTKASEDGEKHEKLLQEQRHSYSKLKRDMEEQTSKLQSDLQDANNKIEKAQTASKKREAQFNSKLQSYTKELADWNNKFDAEVAKNNVVQLDYEATLEEISILKSEHSKLTERHEKCAGLENELAALRSSRTNPQVEKDNIARAVRIATADKQIQVEKLQRALAKVQAEVQGMKTAQKAQAKAENKSEAVAMDKDASIALLKKNMAAMKLVLSKADADLEAALRPDPKILRELDEERMESKHLKDKLEAIATLLKD